ncbi:T9SS type A sorting domain-containing protein [Chryseobacterium sp. Alg-005]|uniref:Ig-like domain-containing protein n=1 Tax=Chryseobacterium sp. Alg-005 TaxID=3159516 RepID=UPI0036F3BAD4
MKQFYNSRIFKNSNKSYLIAIVFCFLLLSGSFSLMNAQVKSYSFAQSTGTFTAITGGTVLGTATANSGAASLYNVSYPVTMPFPFNFNGKIYNDLKVASNGYISFGGTDDPIDNTPISGTENWGGAVSAWGRALNTMFNINNTTGDIRWETLGIAPNREMVIQWTNFRPSYSTSTTTVYAFSFQIRLKETSNEIITTYNSGSYLAGTSTVSGSAQIGLRGATNNDYNNRLNASSLAFASSNPGTANTSTQAYSTSATAVSGMPPAGLTYTWTPPTCFAPTITTSSSTTNSITVNWAGPTPLPSTYDVYYSTSNTPPINTTTPTNPNISGTSVTINLLAPATLYHVWVRSNCGAGNTSGWTPVALSIQTLCQPPAILTTAGATVCPNSTATLSATAEVNADVKWYDAATGGNLIGTGNTYTTPALTTTTHYWVAASNIGTTKNVGPATPASLGASNNTNTAWDLLFTVNTPLTLKTVDIFSGTANQTGTIEILDASGAPVGIIPFVTTGAGNATPQTITLNIYLPAGNYSMRRSGGANLYRNSAGATFPYSTPELVITGTTFTNYPAYYFYFYNLSFTSGCGESSRQQVTATVDATGCLATSETNAKDQMKIYPNPFRDVVTITDIEKIKSIQVLDASGRRVKTIENVTSKEINLGDLKSGLYILNLMLKDGNISNVKAIKQ